MEYGKWDQRSDDRELESARKKIEDLMDDHPSDKFVIAFCGIFSSGKSSLLNELLKLNEREKLPTGIMPITKVITRIEYGRTFEASYVARGKTVSLCREQAEQIAVGNERLPEDCTEIVIRIPSALPGRNMVFLDTPGFQDNAVLDETTRLAVRQADLAVVCCHADHFGNMFEQSYFQDLEDSIGNFCVVINQMDTVLEDEDVLALKRCVKDTIRGRGTDKLRHFTDKTMFYTVGAGKGIDLDGLDSFLIDLREFEEDRRALQEYAEKHRKLYSLKEYRKDVGERISAADRAWKEKEKELTELWNEQKRQHNSTISTIHREAETMSNFFRTRLDGKFAALYARVDRLEETNQLTDFCKKVSAEIKSMAALLAWEMGDQCKNYPALLPYHHPDRYEQALYHIVNEFHVPPPRGRRVKKRGLLGQILESISSSIEMEMIWLDDGYELVYEGYAKEAIRSIREELYRKEIDMTMEYIQTVAADAELEAPTQDRSELDNIENNLQKWKMLDNKMQHFQKRLEWQIQKDFRRNIFITGTLFSGIRTLTTALFRSDSIINTNYLSISNLCCFCRDDADEVVTVSLREQGRKQKTVTIRNSSEYRRFYEEYYRDKFNRPEVEYVTIRTKRINPKYRITLNVTPFYLMHNDDFIYERCKREIRKADAIVFVFNALQPLVREDKEYIAEHFAERQMQNLFFVVNRVNLLRTDEEEEYLKQYVREELTNVFTDQNGTFDDNLFHKRVYYIDALGSMNTRQGKKTKIAHHILAMIPDEVTGVPEFENALIDLLGGGPLLTL